MLIFYKKYYNILIMIIKKNQTQIQNIRVAGNIIAHIFTILQDYLSDGMSTAQIDTYIHEAYHKRRWNSCISWI